MTLHENGKVTHVNFEHVLPAWRVLAAALEAVHLKSAFVSLWGGIHLCSH